MAVEIFLKLPDVNGEASAKGHEKEIEIFSFNIGASNPSSVSTGGGSGAGKVDISSLSIQKQVDSASAKLFLYCCQGKHFDEGTLVVREAGGDEPVEYWTMKMKQVFVDNVKWGAASGGGKSVEVQVRMGSRWKTVGRSIRTDSRGRFRLRDRFVATYSRPVRYRFRAVALRERGWPYLPAAARVRSLVVVP